MAKKAENTEKTRQPHGGALLKRPKGPGPGSPKGPRWATVIREFMDAPAKKDFADLAREMGICGPKQKATMRMAMIARAVKTYMEGQEKVVIIGGGENAHAETVYEKQGDPRILTAIMDREEAKPAQPFEGPDGAAIGFLVVQGPKELEDV